MGVNKQYDRKRLNLRADPRREPQGARKYSSTFVWLPHLQKYFDPKLCVSIPNYTPYRVYCAASVCNQLQLGRSGFDIGQYHSRHFYCTQNVYTLLRNQQVPAVVSPNVTKVEMQHSHGIHNSKRFPCTPHT